MNPIVTDADNGGAISLTADDTLTVRLAENPSTAYAWHTVLAPNGLFALVEDSYTAADQEPGRLGGGGVHEFVFAPRISPNSGATLRGLLRLIQLRPFGRGIAGAPLWEIEVTVNEAGG